MVVEERGRYVIDDVVFSGAGDFNLSGRLSDSLRSREDSLSMTVRITIREVPESVRDELAARAALQGKSMQQYLRAELERLASRPPGETVLERIRERKATVGSRVSLEEVLAHRDADRK